MRLSCMPCTEQKLAVNRLSVDREQAQNPSDSMHRLRLQPQRNADNPRFLRYLREASRGLAGTSRATVSPHEDDQGDLDQVQHRVYSRTAGWAHH